MNTTSTWQQNSNHRTDTVWIKSGRSEYRNGFTGQVIRKADVWITYNAAGQVERRSHSLTVAKRYAAQVAA